MMNLEIKKLPKSPIGMLQEQMWPDQWKILIICMLHNQTSRKQVDKVYQKLFRSYPDAEKMANAQVDELAETLKPLGLYNRRSRSLVRFSKEYLELDWQRTLNSKLKLGYAKFWGGKYFSANNPQWNASPELDTTWIQADFSF